MRMDAGRFREFSGIESENISVTSPSTLKSLEKIDTLLLYEEHSGSAHVDIVRYGQLYDIKLVGKDLVFKFGEKGRFSRTVVKEFAD